MVHSATPRTLQAVTSFEGLLMAKVCTPEHGCVLAQVMAHLQVNDDGSFLATYWDHENHANSQTVVGADRREGEALSRLFTAISAIALAPAQP